MPARSDSVRSQASGVGPERPVRRPRRAAGVGVGAELLPSLSAPVAADDEVARDEIDLLPVLVHEGHRGVDAGLEAQVSCAKASPLFFVERAGKDLLLNAGRIARRHFPAVSQVDCVKLLVFLVYRHPASASWYNPNLRLQGSALHRRAEVFVSIWDPPVRPRSVRLRRSGR